MRVALVTPTLTSNGGVAIHVCASRRALQGAGHEVLFVSSDGTNAEDQLALVGLGSAGRLGGSDAGRILDWLDAEKIDVVHFHDVDDAGLVSATGRVTATVVSAHGWSGCGPGTRYFGTGRECKRAHGPLCAPNMLLRNCKHTRSPFGVSSFYRRATERLSALRAAHVAAAHSTAMAEHLSQNGVDRVQLVPMPIEVPRATPNPPASPPRVAFIGRLTDVKGVDVLLHAARWFEAHIDICGDGYRRPDLIRLADRLGLEQRVTFHGWRSGLELEQIYERATLVVIPSVYPEPFGMVGPEALARCRPVVASQTGGVSDWLDHGVSGLTVPPGDPMALGRAVGELLEAPEESASMGAAGRQGVIERFSEQRHVEALLAAYGAAVGYAG